MRVSDNIHNKMRTITWIICPIVVSFASGMLVDIDHILFGGRQLHEAFNACGIIFIISGAVILLACVCRYALSRILRS